MLKRIKIAERDERHVIENLDFDRRQSPPRDFFLPFIRERDGVGRLIGSNIQKPSFTKSRASKLLSQKPNSKFRKKERMLSNICDYAPKILSQGQIEPSKKIDYQSHSKIWKFEDHTKSNIVRTSTKSKSPVKEIVQNFSAFFQNSMSQKEFSEIRALILPPELLENASIDEGGLSSRYNIDLNVSSKVNTLPEITKITLPDVNSLRLKSQAKDPELLKREIELQEAIHRVYKEEHDSKRTNLPLLKIHNPKKSQGLFRNKSTKNNEELMAESDKVFESYLQMRSQRMKMENELLTGSNFEI